MKQFIIYNSDGEILRTGNCVDSDYSIQKRDGESIMEGTATSGQMVQDGKVVDQPALSDSELNASVLSDLRIERDGMLKWSDWTQMPDSPLSESKQTEWQTYRQQLRDLPASHTSTTSIDQVNYPAEPT